MIIETHSRNGSRHQKIKSLQRPVGHSDLSAMSSRSKRHYVYKTKNELETKLVGSDCLLKHYMKSIERSGERRSIVEDLANEKIYMPPQQVLPEYK